MLMMMNMNDNDPIPQRICKRGSKTFIFRQIMFQFSYKNEFFSRKELSNKNSSLTHGNTRAKKICIRK